MEEGQTPAAPSSKLVLLVDDDESLLDLMDHVVKKEGFRTDRAMDAKSIEMVRQESNVKDFLQKPVRPVMLTLALHRVLGTAPPGGAA